MIKKILSCLFVCFVGSLTAQTVGQYELRKRTSTGFTAYGITLSNGQVIGQTAGIPAAITPALSSDLAAYAPLASPTFTGTVTIPGGASISGYLTTATAASTYQPLSATLTTLSSATAAGLALMDDATAAAQRTTLGLGTLATQSATITDYLTTATAASTYQTTAGILNLSGFSAVIGNITVNNLNGGVNATSSTFWRGDGTWATAGAGTVTSVGFTGGIISVATATTTPALTVAGTSGGIPYFSSSSTWASSAALAANSIVIGGGAGVAPSTTTTGTGVLTALGINTGSSGAFVVNGGALGTPSSGTGTNITGIPVSSGISGLGTGVAAWLAAPSTANITPLLVGSSNSTSGSNSIVVGSGNTNGGLGALVVGSSNGNASGDFSLVTGYASRNTWACARVLSSGYIADWGDAQLREIVIKGSTTTSTPTEILGFGASQRIVLPNDSTFAFQIIVVARRGDANDESAGYIITGVIDRNASAATTTLVGTPTVTVLSEDDASWDVAVSADTTNGSLKITVTGATSKTIGWVAVVKVSSVTY